MVDWIWQLAAEAVLPKGQIAAGLRATFALQRVGDAYWLARRWLFIDGRFWLIT